MDASQTHPEDKYFMLIDGSAIQHDCWMHVWNDISFNNARIKRCESCFWKQLCLNTLEYNSPVESAMRKDITVKPGITGYWQLFGNREDGIKNVISCDKYYQNNMSLKLDLYLLLKTLPVIIKGRHCDALISNYENIEIQKAKIIPVIYPSPTSIH